jgi:multidrug efflux pump
VRAHAEAQGRAHPSRFERISEGLFDKTLAAYERGLRLGLAHQTLT